MRTFDICYILWSFLISQVYSEKSWVEASITYDFDI